MPTTTTLLQFALASLVLAVTPGPSLVLLLAVGADRGRRAGVATALGLALGTSVWGVVAAAGLGSLLGARPGLLRAVTAAGGGYLLWLAGERFRHARRMRGGDVVASAPADHDPTAGAVRDGVVVNLLNPSIAIFLASIVPPFLAVEAGPLWLQVLVLSAVLVVASTVVNIGAGLLGAAAGRGARQWVGGRRTVLAAAVAYAALGVLALTVAITR